MSVIAIFQQLGLHFGKELQFEHPSLISATSQQVRSKSDAAQSDDTITIFTSWYKVIVRTNW